jgi:hypothetical protein
MDASCTKALSSEEISREYSQLTSPIYVSWRIHAPTSYNPYSKARGAGNNGSPRSTCHPQAGSAETALRGTVTVENRLWCSFGLIKGYGCRHRRRSGNAWSPSSGRPRVTRSRVRTAPRYSQRPNGAYMIPSTHTINACRRRHDLDSQPCMRITS